MARSCWRIRKTACLELQRSWPAVLVIMPTVLRPSRAVLTQHGRQLQARARLMVSNIYSLTSETVFACTMFTVFSLLAVVLPSFLIYWFLLNVKQFGNTELSFRSVVRRNGSIFVFCLTFPSSECPFVRPSVCMSVRTSYVSLQTFNLQLFKFNCC